MTTLDILQETYVALSANKVRTALTMLGIIIGISSVITMVAIGAGAQGTIESRIQSLGSNLIEVMPGAQRGQGFGVSTGRGAARTLTEDDAAAIASEIASITAIAPEISSRYQIVAKGTNTNTSVIGVTSSYPQVRNIQIDEGSFISDQNNASGAKVAVLGPTVRDDLFGAGTTGVVGQTIRINKLEFKVIGITVAKGGTGFGSQDNMIYVPLASAERYLSGSKYMTTISIQAADSKSMAQVQEDVTNLLLTRHRISDPTLADFSVLNQNDIISAASSVTDTFTILLAAVAGISLLVGGIGIMNMMLTTVTERTKEIGLRKAIGAKKKDISLQFLTESVMLTFLGGLMGIILGWLISFGFTYFGIIETSMSISSVFLAFGVSAAIGIIFGYYPARRAAGLNPIEALRYE
jgi:putative ABC transport system permease protein